MVYPLNALMIFYFFLKIKNLERILFTVVFVLVYVYADRRGGVVPGFAQRVEALQFIYFEGKKKIF